MRSVFSFLLVCSLLVPIQARAAETVTREKTFQTEENSEEAFAQQSGIADLVEEDGKTYELQDVSYEVLEKKYLGNVEKVTDSEVMAEGTAYEPPKTLREGNLTYTLKKTEKQERSIEGEYTQPVSAFDEYDHPVGAGDVPQTKTVSVLNQKTGQNQDVVCTFSGISTAGTAVRENQITITFQEYDASVYEWNGNLYVKTNSKLFADGNWKRLKPAQKLLAMDLYHISRASKGRTYRIGRQNFLEKYADRKNPDGSIRRGKLGISERTLQKYLKMLKLYFYIGIKEGMYYITLRSVFAEEAVASENNQTYDRLVQVACRRNRIGACDKKEARQIRDVLVYYRKLLLEKNVYILDIFTRMIETINVQRIRPAKWKRYLKKSLFHKILREEYLFA